MRYKRGYSIIEIMLVLTIVAAITTITLNVFSRNTEKANSLVVESDLAKLANQLELYRQRHGTYEVDKNKFESTHLELLITHSPSYLPFAKRQFDLAVSSASKLDYALIARPINESSARVILYSNGSVLWDEEE